ncbi:hypothetical protein [Dysgonomonas sp. Marseille-P4361]|uniref:hypothetical protein n=1 Tax=Dysgonomonas sp. Marseille-P4361 TaxID=2161820 RepID=UPI000D54ED4D|nr:hypothetical protein [Dysgonomonas sp. Marseille-P4361]
MAKKQADKQAVLDWDKYVQNIQAETTIDSNMSYAEREKKRKELEADPIEWMYEMFPNYAKSKFAKWQITIILLIINNPEFYAVLSWARELAKSTTVMMIVMYLTLTGKKRNVLLVSNSYDNAERLLAPYKANFEGNKRIEFYYGKQKGLKWENGEFITKKGAAFRALGAGQSPRGTRVDDIRPDILLPDDFDTDEDCRNLDTINKKWEWWETALYFTRSWSQPLLTIWSGNIIAKDCCIVRAGNKARELSKIVHDETKGKVKKGLGIWDIKNIRMVNINKPDPKNDFLYGTSVWLEKNSEEQIDIVQSQVSASAVQKECYNNPISEGDTFKEITWGKVPPLNKFPFLINYSDPSPSNNTKAKANSNKACFLVGLYEGKLYVITGYLDRVTNAEFVDWFYFIDKYVVERNQVYNYIENNTLQNPFYEQVFIPLFAQARSKYNKIINITPDERRKPDKFARIEGNLEPLNRMGNLILNEAEKNNPHMQRLEEQFKMVTPRLSAPADGVDCIEGGYFIANQKLSTLVPDAISFGTKPTNNKRF